MSCLLPSYEEAYASHLEDEGPDLEYGLTADFMARLASSQPTPMATPRLCSQETPRDSGDDFARAMQQYEMQQRVVRGDRFAPPPPSSTAAPVLPPLASPAGLPQTPAAPALPQPQTAAAPTPGPPAEGKSSATPRPRARPPQPREEEACRDDRRARLPPAGHKTTGKAARREPPPAQKVAPARAKRESAPASAPASKNDAAAKAIARSIESLKRARRDLDEQIAAQEKLRRRLRVETA